jgi:hypothetical protein
MRTEWDGDQAGYLLGCLREEDAAGRLLGLHQLLHQHPVQRRDQTLRHCRTPVLSFPSCETRKANKLEASTTTSRLRRLLPGFRVLRGGGGAEMTILPLEVRAAQRASDSPGRSRTFHASWAFSEKKKKKRPICF